MSQSCCRYRYLSLLVVALELLLATPRLHAATRVSGVIADQTWRAAGSPYEVTGDLLVASLTIEPGVEVRVLGAHTIEVAGFLKAEGTADKPIRFGPGGTASTWNGIFYNEAPSGSVLRHCRIEGSSAGGVRITNSLPELAHCTIVGNRTPGSGGGLSIYLLTGSVVVDSCIITNNVAVGDGGGVWILGRAQVRQSTITQNRSANGGGVGLGPSGVLQIANSFVAHNTSLRLGGGLWAGASSHLTAVNCLVASNRTQYGGGGRSEGGAIVRYLNCTVVRNQPDGLSDCGSTISVTNSVIYQNEPGPWLSRGCGGTLGIAYSNTQGGIPEPGTGNKSSNPALDPVTFRLLPGSPCIDAGHPAAVYNDGCRPPALGGERNDMGAFGGLGGCQGIGVEVEDTPGGLLANGGFEAPMVPVESFLTATPLAWRWEGPSGAVFNGRGGDPSVWPAAPEGNQYLDLGNHSPYALMQSFSVPSTARYRLRWLDSTGQNAGLTTSPYAVSILDGGGLSLVRTNLDAYHDAFGLWVERGWEGVLAAGTYTLVYRAQGQGGLDSLIDDVRLVTLPGPPLSAPTLVQHPSNATARVGSQVTLTVLAEGTPPLTYRWLKGSTPLEEGGRVVGSTHNQLLLSGLQTADAGLYSVVVGNALGSATSHSASVTVLPDLPPNLPRGLVAWWPGDGDATDRVGSHHGAPEGDVAYARGKVGACFDFRAPGQSIVVPDAPTLDLTRSFTIAAWIQARGEPFGPGGGGGIVSKIGGSGGNNGFQFDVLTGLQGLDGIFNAPGESWPANHLRARLAAPLGVGAWAHVAYIYDGEFARIRVDGTEVGTLRVGSKAVVNSASRLRISGDDNGNVFFNGLIDEVMVFDRALPADELDRLAAGIPLDPPLLPIAWQAGFGGAGFDEVLDLVAEPNGDFVLAGYSTSPVSGNKEAAGSGDRDFWLLRIDATGRKVWDRVYGGSSLDYSFAVQRRPEGGWILGGTSSSPPGPGKSALQRGGDDFWLVAVDAQGERLWDESYGGVGTEELNAILPAPGNGWLLCGGSYSGVSGNKTSPRFGQNDGWVVRVDAQGRKLWEKALGSSESDHVYAGAIATNGWLLAAFSGTARDGNKDVPGYGHRDLWLVRLDVDGNILWQRGFGGDADDVPRVVLPVPDGGWLVAADTASGATGNKNSAGKGGVDRWLLRLDSDGRLLWERSLGGTGDDSVQALVPLAGGGWLAGGPAAAERPGASQDYMLTWLDAQGAVVSEHWMGGAGHDRLQRISAGLDGSFLLAGSTEGPPSGDRTTLSFGERDLWVVRLGAELVPPPTLAIFRSGSDLRLRLGGRVGSTYLIEASTVARDIMTWAPAASITLTNEVAEIDPAPNPGAGQGYFRARVRP